MALLKLLNSNKKEKRTEKDAKEIQRLVIELGGLEKATHLAEKYKQKAMNRIKQLPVRLEKEQFKGIIASLLNRHI